MEEENDEVYFWHLEKHQSSPQVVFIILGVSSQAGMPKVPKI